MPCVLTLRGELAPVGHFEQLVLSFAVAGEPSLEKDSTQGGQLSWRDTAILGGPDCLAN